jgi:hypothetical protein
MLATSSGVTTAIESGTYSDDVRVQITLPGNVLTDASLSVESCTITASTTSDMPDGTRFAVGYPAIACDFTLSGNLVVGGVSFSAADLFSPYSTGSPLYRQSATGALVTVDVAVFGGTSTESAPEWLRKFTGMVDTYTTDPVGGTVAFQCVDFRSRLRSLPNLPAVVTAPPFNSGLTGEFAADWLLRQASNYAFTSWPATDADHVLAVGFRSSIWPEIGTLDTTGYSNPFLFKPGVFGSAMYGPDGPFGAATSLPYLVALPVGTAYGFDFWASSLPASGNEQLTLGATSSLTADCVQIATARAQVSVTFTASNGVNSTWNQTVPTATSHRVSAALTLPAIGSSVVTGTLWVDGTAYTVTTTATAGSRAANYSHVTVDTFGIAGIEGLRITTAASPTFPTFTPAAVLDPAAFTPLDAVPPISGDPWQTLQQMGDASLSVLGFDEGGTFRATGRATLRSSASVRDVTATTSLKTLAFETSAAGAANVVQVPYSGWEFGASTLVYTAKARNKIAARTTRVWTVKLDEGSLVAQVASPAVYLGAGQSISNGQTRYRVSLDRYGLNEHPNPPDVTLTQPDPGRITITVANHTGQDAWLVSPANYVDMDVGVPALWINGIAVAQADEQTTSFSLPALDPNVGDVVVALSSNPWSQDSDTAEALAFSLCDELYQPGPNITGIDIIPDPRLQLMDRVHLVDADVSGIDEYVILWGWTLSFADSAWSQSIDARAVAAPGQWILEVAGRSELGTATWI